MKTLSSDIAKTKEFFERAFPNPEPKNFSTQLGVHFEEVAEMLRALEPQTIAAGALWGLNVQMLENLSTFLKENPDQFVIKDRIEFLDGLCDQIVTATGVGHMAGMAMAPAMAEINDSNFSKFDDNGDPILDENKKMMKGPHYRKPNLSYYV